MAKNSHFEIVVFGDGGCKGNPGPGGWGAVAVSSALARVKEAGGGLPHTTNNVMELRAAIEALRLAESFGGSEQILACTDSSYVVQGATGWIHGWRKRGWKKVDGSDVLNRSLWEELGVACDRLGRRLSWQHLPSHVGIPGNERVDEIATAFSEGVEVELYDGPLAECGFNPFEKIDAETARTLSAQKKAGVSGKGKKPSGPIAPGYPIYLSYVGGRLERHKAWSDCERRVKGVGGAKFKKVSNPEEEKNTLGGWGC